MIQKVVEIAHTSSDVAVKNVLMRVISLYGASALDKHMTILYQGGYASGSKPADLIRQGILELCAKLKTDAVSLVDAVAPPDFLITSPLGKSDGEVRLS